MPQSVTPEILIDAFEKLREYPTFRRAAVVTKHKFYLRGSTIRNLFLRLRNAQGSIETLFDLVDPLSDIDLVVERAHHWPGLARILGEELPGGRYFRWEARTVEQVQRDASYFERIAADRLAVEITPNPT